MSSSSRTSSSSRRDKRSKQKTLITTTQVQLVGSEEEDEEPPVFSVFKEKNQQQGYQQQQLLQQSNNNNRNHNHHHRHRSSKGSSTSSGDSDSNNNNPHRNYYNKYLPQQNNNHAKNHNRLVTNQAVSESTLFEYSDTSADEHEREKDNLLEEGLEGFTASAPPKQINNINNINNTGSNNSNHLQQLRVQQLQPQKSTSYSSVKSSFRFLNDTLSKSQRVVDMTSTTPTSHDADEEDNDGDDDDDDEDEEEEEDEDEENQQQEHQTTFAKQQQQKQYAIQTTGQPQLQQPPKAGSYYSGLQNSHYHHHHYGPNRHAAPNPATSGTFSSEHSHSSSIQQQQSQHHHNPHASGTAGGGAMVGTWMEKLAYSFRSPVVTAGHKRVSSSNMIEYPHALSSSSKANTPSSKEEEEQDQLRLMDQQQQQHPLMNGMSGSAAKTTISNATVTTTTAAASTAAFERSKPVNLNQVAAGLARKGSSSSGGSKSPRGSLHDESTPLLLRTFSPELATSPSTRPLASPSSPSTYDFYIEIAASFLMDYEANRPPSLSHDLTEITPRQLRFHQIKFSNHIFPALLISATMAFFFSSGLEGFGLTQRQRVLLTLLNFYAIAIFAVDLWIRSGLRNTSTTPTNFRGSVTTATTTTTTSGNKNKNGSSDNNKKDNNNNMRVSTASAVYGSMAAAARLHSRDSRSGRIVKPLILFGTVLACENLARLIATSDSLVLLSSIFKPLVLYYVSYQARNAISAFRRIIRVVVRVLIMEALLILMFAAVACHLFGDYEPFQDLSTSWLSLFELSTTVVNPSIWMPIYRETKFSAIFFVFYIVTAVFYLHSLVLSVVFQTYIHAASEIHERSVGDREDAIQLAYLALQQQQQQGTEKGIQSKNVEMQLVRDVLQRVRPHYNAFKINALVEIVDPLAQGHVDYPTFRTKIRQALNASIRTSRNATPLAVAVELIAVIVAVTNFAYVIMVSSSSFDSERFGYVKEYVGITITLASAAELLIRFNPCRIVDFTPLTRLNATFDGLALIASLISSFAIVLYLAGVQDSLDFMLMGRAIDMFRITRFFRIFRDVVKRSADVLPVLTGPIVLVVTTLHIFVYLGMALWGGSVSVGAHEGRITPLYDLNNFNSYEEGAVTMFQVLVVNDWHAIAQVFLFASRCKSPYIVYPFFVIANLIGVSIMLNVLTAFFVESFVTKINDDSEGRSPIPNSNNHFQKEMSIRLTENSVRRITSASSLKDLAAAAVAAVDTNTDTPVSSERVLRGNEHDFQDDDPEWDDCSSEFYEFDVYERSGVDKIMQTVSGVSPDMNDLARNICDYLEIFESLSPGREPVGFLICDQQTLERFGNERFKKQAKDYLKENELHMVVSDMHAELLVLSSRAAFQDRSLVRQFSSSADDETVLEITACLLRIHPAVSLFVSRHILREPPAPLPTASHSLT